MVLGKHVFFCFAFIFRLCVCLWVSWCHSLLLGDQNAVCTEHLVTLMWKYIASVLGPPGTSEQRCHKETELPFVGFVPRIESCCMQPCPFCRWSSSLPASWKTTKLFILATTCSSQLCCFTRGCQPFPIQSIASFGRADAKNKTPFGQILNILRES